MSNDATDQGPQGQTLTSADRIRQLSEIDQDVTKLIHSAGLAVQALTNTKPESGPDSAGDSLESHKAQFREATSRYFALLSSIDVRLRRQVYALEEASLLKPESMSQTGDATGTGGVGTVASTAANPLDISWLNSRKDTVGKDKEAELWAAARQYVEQLDKTTVGNENANQPAGNSEEMQVD
ncbi:hypothetical protein N7492_002331 [Penicillium capsulatum]|uniref:Mediator of RNA polymerase II transcription subunit 11 n=1 Tax=Penicillium capsulatum TaxID=69766 RepID=A0A9W9IL79_9EURO|nr:hypothetical protein N7492_002331 [Penicillium capsulatum]KAJ6123063.1 hypothetical protein N7512_005528 [Penicillium capsulatum]